MNLPAKAVNGSRMTSYVGDYEYVRGVKTRVIR